jgi:FkbM family methyltransferase
MTKLIKEKIKKVIRNLGFDLVRYNSESSISARIVQLLSTNKIDTVLDVGANVGQYAKSLRESGFKGRIISFEPLSKVYPNLVGNSRMDPKWIVAPRMALGSEDSKKTINIAANYVSSSILDMLDTHTKGAPESVYICSENTRVAKLDTIKSDYLKPKNLAFLKIDVQGFELQVLEGAQKTLPYIKGIQIELSLVPLYEGQLLFRDMLDYIAHLGLELCDILPGFRDKKTGRLLQVDGIFFRPLKPKYK